MATSHTSDVTPDKKLRSLLSSFIYKSISDKGSKRKRSISEGPAQATEDISLDSGATERKRKHVDSQDEEAFFERVQSFNMVSWFAKPRQLSPLICAQYGWKNIEKDILKCVGCQAVLCAQLPKNADSLIYQESCRKLIKSIKSAHQKSCFWPAYPSPDNYLRIPVKDKGKVVSLIKEYICSLQRVQHLLPNVSLEGFSEKGLSSNHLEEMKSIAEAAFEYHHVDNIDLGTFCLAVTGWKSVDEKTGMLACHFCCRKVGLWNYKKRNDVNIDESSEESDIEIPSNSQTQNENHSAIETDIPVLEDKSSPHLLPRNDNACTEKVIADTGNRNCDSNTLKVEQNNQENIESYLDDFHFAQPKSLDFSQQIIDSEKEIKEKEAMDVQENVPIQGRPDVEKVFTFSSPSLVDMGTNYDCSLPHVDSDECSHEMEKGIKDSTKSLSANIVEDKGFTDNIIPSNGENSQSSISSEFNRMSDTEQGRNCDTADQDFNGDDDTVVRSSSNDQVGNKLSSASDNSTEQGTFNNGARNDGTTETSIGQQSHDQSSSISKSAGRKKIKVVKKDSFNPFEEHRYWCPWINMLPDNVSYSPQKINRSTDDRSLFSYPWEHILQVICPSFFEIQEDDSITEHFKQHSPVAGLRQLRKLMKDWSN